MKKSVVSCCKVSGNQIEKIRNQLKIIDCLNEFTVLFAGQMPISAILIIRGSLNIYSGKKCVSSYSGTNLLLYDEFLNARPVKYTIKISDDAQFGWVEKCFINKLLVDSNELAKST